MGPVFVQVLGQLFYVTAVFCLRPFVSSSMSMLTSWSWLYVLACACSVIVDPFIRLVFGHVYDQCISGHLCVWSLNSCPLFEWALGPSKHTLWHPLGLLTNGVDTELNSQFSEELSW